MKNIILSLICFTCFLESPAQIPFSNLLLGLQFGGNFSDVSANQFILSENTSSLTVDRNGNENNAAMFEENQKINIALSSNFGLLAGVISGQITFSCRVQINETWLNNLPLNTEINLVNNGKSYIRISKGALNNVLVLKGGIFNNNSLQGTNGFLETSVILRNTSNGNLPGWNPGADDWNTFTLSYDANSGEPTLGLFVNGSLKSSNSATYVTANLIYDTETDKFEIGSSILLPQGFRGKMDDVYIYDRALSLNEIITLDTLSIFTGIENNNSNSTILLYPNPVNNAVNISSERNIGEIMIFSLLGNLILSEKANSLKHQLNLSSLSSGIYLLKNKGVFYKILKE
jgi:hypothetical protein